MGCNNNNFIPFSIPLRCPHINHLAYVDDIVIFSGGNSNSITLIMNILHSYEKSFGQKVNKDKGFFLTTTKTVVVIINIFRECTDFMDKEFPFTYLGCPIYIGRKKTVYFNGMVNSIVKKLNSWHGKLLSYGGKVILIKNVLQVLPTYSLCAMCPPKATFKLIDKYLPISFGDRQNT
ncbi:uncharacterized protein [Nicotiana sylvestris]|uniref:uncharacterized protein n=1 Tax=Nicotiana sylvestris TaxID=4096 RepID=UPI00388C7DF8